MNDRPFVLFLTWTTYGSWLPGDRRGHISATLEPSGRYQPRQNKLGTPFAAGDGPTWQRAKELQQFPTVWLTPGQARIVAVTLVAASSERAWSIAAAAVMAGHMHIVIGGCPDDASAVRRALKGCSQVALSRAVGKSLRWWTRHGSDRYLHDRRSIDAAIRYVEGQAKCLAAIRNDLVVE